MEQIRKKIRKIIKESYTEDTHYETKLEGFDIYLEGLDKIMGIDRTTIDFKPEFSVIWYLYLESRTWGIKHISPSVSNILGKIEWTVEKEFLNEEEINSLRKISEWESDTYLEGVIELNSLDKFNGKDWTLDYESFEINNSGSIYPTSINIDFTRMKIRIM